MDSLTHLLVGASIGEAMLGRKAGKRAMLFGAIAGSLPDVDAVLNFFVSDLEALLLHRGITHSLFMALIAGPLIGLGLWRYYRDKRGSTRAWMGMVTLNIVIHDLLDAATIYGTKLLLPFSDHRFSFDNIFVADPLYTVPLLVSVTALMVIRRTGTSRRHWNLAGLGISTGYFLMTFVNQHFAVKALDRAYELSGKTRQEYFAAPTLLNNILWNVVVKVEDGFLIGYYSLFDQSNTADLHFVPRNDSMGSKVGDAAALVQLKKFSNGFYSLSEKEGRIYFNDLRFGQIGGWQNPDAGFAFAFDLTPGTNNSMVVQRGRMEGSKREMLYSLWNRIGGR